MSEKNGWIVCIACVIHNFIISAIAYSFGVFIAEFQQLYQISMAELGKSFTKLYGQTREMIIFKQRYKKKYMLNVSDLKLELFIPNEILCFYIFFIFLILMILWPNKY